MPGRITGRSTCALARRHRARRTASLAFGWLGERLPRLPRGPWWARGRRLAALVVASAGRSAAARRLAGFIARAPLGVLDADAPRLARRPAEGLRDRRRAPGRLIQLLVVLAHAFRRGGRWSRAARPPASCCCSCFVAPVVLEPLFNRFAPLEDGELAAGCARWPSAPACRCARCSSPTRAGARASKRLRLRARPHAPGRPLRHAARRRGPAGARGRRRARARRTAPPGRGQADGARHGRGGGIRGRRLGFCSGASTRRTRRRSCSSRPRSSSSQRRSTLGCHAAGSAPPTGSRSS